jgi:excisionase family DNA binding protein
MGSTTMTLGEAAFRLRLSYQVVRSLVTRGRLDGFQVDGRYSAWRVSRASVERYRRRLVRADA